MDMSPVVTELRETLKSTSTFSAWLKSVDDDFRFGGLDSKKSEEGIITPGKPGCEGTPMAYFLQSRGLDKPMSDSTHCYWWDGPQAYSLMLPPWARAFHKAVGTSPNGKAAKSSL